MHGGTKNHQSETTLKRLVNTGYPGHCATKITELTEGFFNVAYRIELDDGSHSILKVAPPQSVPIMSYERNIMQVEVMAMRLASALAGVPVPQVIAYDSSLDLCSSEYFFMTEIPGNSLNALRDQGLIADADYEHIIGNLGSMNRCINTITNETFGYPGQISTLSQSWHQAFSTMLRMGLDSAESFGVDLQIDRWKLESDLQSDQELFAQVCTPSLVHWDLWDGNVFIDDGEISGIIDWERAIWADPLMEVGFRSWNRKQAFLDGYGMAAFTPEQERRSLWYDIYMLVLTAQEPVARNYDNDEMYRLSISQLLRILSQE